MFGKNKIKVTDKIWMTKKFKMRGIVDHLSSILSKRSSVILFTHFKKSLEEICSVLNEYQIKYSIVDHTTDLFTVLNTEFDHVLVSSSEQIPRSMFGQIQNKSNELISIIVSEHHPLQEEDARIIEYGKTVTTNCEVVFFSCLEDELFKYFGSEQVIGAIRRLMKDDSEPLEHKMISNSIISAQRRLKTKAKFNHRADSVEEWFKYNL